MIPLLDRAATPRPLPSLASRRALPGIRRAIFEGFYNPVVVVQYLGVLVVLRLQHSGKRIGQRVELVQYLRQLNLLALPGRGAPDHAAPPVR